MNFKSIGLAGVAAATLMTAATVTVAPANASSIAASQLSFNGSAQFRTTKTNGGVSRLDFTPYKYAAFFNIADVENHLDRKLYGQANITGGSTGYFGGRSFPDKASDEAFRIKDLDFTNVYSAMAPLRKWTLAGGPISEFFKFKDGVTFTLNSFILKERLNDEGKKIVSGDYTGVFLDQGNQFPGFDGSFSLEKNFAKGDAIASSITPIPTPMLLPGLIGMGVAALRKRKSEESDVEAAETAKA